MITIDDNNPVALARFANMVAERIVALQGPQESEYMSFREIKERKNISADTLTRWIKEANIKTRRYGSGKAIKRKDFTKLP